LCALASVVTWAAVFLLPVFVQSVQGRPALAAGIAMAPQGLVTGLSTVLGSRVLTRFTVRSTVRCGFFVLGVASPLVEVVGAGTPLWVISLILAARRQRLPCPRWRTRACWTSRPVRIPLRLRALTIVTYLVNYFRHG
jgi:hypothetical protein